MPAELSLFKPWFWSPDNVQFYFKNVVSDFLFVRRKIAQKSLYVILNLLSSQLQGGTGCKNWCVGKFQAQAAPPKAQGVPCATWDPGLTTYGPAAHGLWEHTAWT